MRDDICNEHNELYDGKNLSSCKAGVFWWQGSYNCTAVYGSENSWPGYSISKTDEGDNHIYEAEIPADVENIIFNNMVKMTSDNPDLKYSAAQTIELSLKGYEAGESPYGLYPDGLSSVDGMIYVSGRNDSQSEYSPIESKGAWFYYYGNGKYGVYKTLKEAEENGAVYSDGNFPKKIDKKIAKPDVKTKKSNPIKVTVKAKSVKLKKLKKKTQSIMPITVKSAQGTVSYSLVKKGSTAKIFKLAKINKKGVITLKKLKKAKKGTYKLKVKITAKGNSEYKSKTINKVVKVKVE